ncbi:outer membrane protein [Chelativorans sp. Marseille-P2723]|uniref:outer membrane protein n=1 Tax=Chelativorans sp. Marseille-P2723 TaxID=2709133 RepID=UPI00156F0C8C|nr:outer membrane protein [Chelativorans sp. Marseille-P2723]
MKVLRIPLLTSFCFMAPAGSIWAADPTFYQPIPQPVPVAKYDWSGPYLGIQGGYGWTDLDGEADFFDEIDGMEAPLDLKGGFIGAFAGYNFQSGRFVYGVEGDINKAWMDEDFTFSTAPANAEVDWFGSLRARLGYGLDRTLLYATGGLAHAEVGMRLDSFDFAQDKGMTGWTLGAGVEHAITSTLLARGEYRYYDFGGGTFGSPAVGEHDLDLSMHTLSLGLAYKF